VWSGKGAVEVPTLDALSDQTGRGVESVGSERMNWGQNIPEIPV